MLAYRNVGGSIKQIDVDLDAQGNPLLPPDTTVDPRPEPNENHYVTVVGNSWVQIPIPQPFFTFETIKARKLDEAEEYQKKLLDKPYDVNGTLFDGDEITRSRLIQALVINNTNGYLPPAWVGKNKKTKPITQRQDLIDIITTIQNDFANRFFQAETIKQGILAATTQAELDAIVIPQEV